MLEIKYHQEYWANNSFELNNKITAVKELLKLRTPKNTTFKRLGSVHDGGYVVADDISSTDHVVSFGVEGNIDFEKDLSGYGCHIDMYDYSVDKPPLNLPNSKFFKEKIGVSADCTSLQECLNKTDKDIFLKVDIEGSEWDVFSAASEDDLNRCRQITIEAHWLQNLPYEAFYNAVVLALTNLRKTHTPVFLHPNNNQPLMVLGNYPVPTVFEVLYLRNSSYKFEKDKDLFAGLITRNDTNFPEIGLSFP
jgi:hypothetical protein